MTDGHGPGLDGDDATGLNRRRLLRAIGGTTAGLVAITGTASAHVNQFFGCTEVCTDTDGNLAVVETGGDYECRPIERSTVRDDVPWDWQAHCYEASAGEAIVGMIEEEIWQGASRDEDRDCKLCVNPNDCATEYYDDVSEVVDGLNASGTCGICRGNVVVGDCESFGTDGGSSSDGDGGDGSGGNGDGDGSGDGSGDGGDGDGGEPVLKLTAGDGSSEERLGWSVAVNDAGDRIVAGAPKTDRLFQDPGVTGTAYVFDYDGTSWSQTATLASSDTVAGDAFGWDVTVDESGDRILVGAPRSDGNENEAGAAYLYEFDGTNWSETAKLIAASGSSFDRFGSAVALDDAGDTALVGAQGEAPMGAPSAGAAYAFQVQSGTWTQVDRILLNEGDDDAVGTSVDVDAAGDDGIVGGPGVGPSVTGFASVVSNGANWTESERFQPSTLEDVDHFGSDVALDDPASVAVAGVRSDDVGGSSDQGSAFVFADHGGWSQQTKLTASDGAADDEYGTSVDVDGDGNLTLIGAPGASGPGGTDSGAAYTYIYDGSWGSETKLTPSSGTDGDEYGAAVALDDTRQIAVVGAPGDDDVATDAGAFYVHSL